MRYAILLAILLTIAAPAHAEIFMYQDSSGQWHGVSSQDQIPSQYRDKSATVNNADKSSPEEIQDQERENEKEEREYEENQKQKAEAGKKDAIVNLKKETQDKKQRHKEVKALFENFFRNQLGTDPANPSDWQLTGYSIYHISISGFPSASVIMHANFSDESGDKVERIYHYSGEYEDDEFGRGWKFESNDCDEGRFRLVTNLSPK